MSLINDMLSNLEKRRADASERPSLQGFSAVDEFGANRRDRLRRFQNSVICVALIAIIGLPVGLLINRLVKMNTPASSATVVAAVVAPLATPPVVPPVALTVTPPVTPLIPATVPTTPEPAIATACQVPQQNQAAIVDDANTPMGMETVAATEPPPVDTTTAEPALPAWANAPVPPADKNPRVTVIAAVTKPQPVAGPPQMKITPYQPDALDQALQVMQSGDYPRAVRELKTLQSSRANDVNVVRGLAHAYAANGDQSMLLTWLPLQLKQWPNDSELRLILARTQLQAADAKSAVATLEQNQPQLAQEPAYFALLAACYQQTAQWKKSAALYEQLTQLRPSQAAWQLGLGIALERLEQPNEAVRHYRFAERGQGLDDSARRFASDRAIALAGK